MASLQSQLLTDDNHPINKINVGTSFRRKSAFTLSRKGSCSALSIKRHSLQLAPTLKGTHERTREYSCKDAHESTRVVSGLTDCHWTSRLGSQCNEIGRDATYPQELNPAASLLQYVSLHSRNYGHIEQS